MKKITEELIQKSSKDLEKLLLEVNSEIANKAQAKYVGKNKNLKESKNLRIKRARIKTILKLKGEETK